MNFPQAIKSVFSHFAAFQGRAMRSEFWWWVLFMFIVIGIANVIDAYYIGPALGFDVGDQLAGQPLSLLMTVLLLSPTLAIGVRRLHDINRSGWWLLIALTGIGAFFLAYWFIKDGIHGTNRFGVDAKGRLSPQDYDY